MKVPVLFTVLLACVLATPHSRPVTDEVAEKPQLFDLAEACDAEACQLPDCRCSSTDIPGGLAARDTPQVSCLAMIYYNFKEITLY